MRWSSTESGVSHPSKNVWIRSGVERIAKYGYTDAIYGSRACHAGHHAGPRVRFSLPEGATQIRGAIFLGSTMRVRV